MTTHPTDPTDAKPQAGARERWEQAWTSFPRAVRVEVLDAMKLEVLVGEMGAGPQAKALCAAVRLLECIHADAD